MRFITITALALLATAGTQPAAAQTLYTCGDGTVRSVRTIVEMVSRGPVVSTFDTWGEPQQLVEFPRPEPRRAHVVTVQLFNVNYTGEAFGDDPENFDPTRLTDGDQISICVNRFQMILDRGDGTDFRATMVRSDRVKRPTGTNIH